MSPVTIRLILSMLLLPAALLFYALTYDILPRLSFYLWDVIGQLAAMALSLAALATGWIAIWKPVLPWTQRHRRGAFVAAGGALVLAIVITFPMMFVGPAYYDALFLLGAMWALAWLAGTAIVWRETPEERMARLQQPVAEIACPGCGYNLKGLHEARCPECGATFTLDQLYGELLHHHGEAEQV